MPAQKNNFYVILRADMLAGEITNDDGVLWPNAAGECQARQLDPDDAGQGLVRDLPTLRPARTVLHEEMAPGRGRVGEVMVASVVKRAGRLSRWRKGPLSTKANSKQQSR